MADHLSGVFTPVVTPFKDDFSVDSERLIAQCRWLIARDCGLAIFGTNSEGTSLSVGERIELIDQLIEAGLPPERMMPGTGTSALPDTVALCAHVAKSGCGGALVLPPYYYKAATEDGLFAYFASLIEKVGDDRMKLYLYHIPPVAGIGFPMSLYERLIKTYPTVVVGTKDSSQDNPHTQALIDNFPGFAVFPGNETALASFMKNGAAGTIAATCNVNTAAIVKLYKDPNAPDAEAQQARLNEVRGTFAKYPMIAAMKATIAAANNDPVWRNLRPPLEPLSPEQETALAADLKAIGFTYDA